MANSEAILATNAQHVAIIDYTALNALKGVPNLYEETLKVVQDKIGRMQQLRTQAELTSDNLKAFGDLAHGLKSGICMIGCTRLAHVCHQLELLGRSENISNAETLVTLYDQVLPGVLQETMASLQEALR
eukprot:m.23467 g.23467  ORF g.23467 m.23467 type:complete len:130 (-) comp11386_c0_seq1:737-1126(-)